MAFLVSLRVWARPTLVDLMSVTVLLRVATASVFAERLVLRVSALAAAVAAAASAPWVDCWAAASLASLSAFSRLRASIWACWLCICSRSSRIWRSIGVSTGAFFVAGFLVVVVFLGVVVLVCACSDNELITSIADMVARSCFVMEPRKIWKGTRTARKPVGCEAQPEFLPLLFGSSSQTSVNTGIICFG